MTGIRVTHSVDDLADDLRTIAVSGRAKFARVVQRNVQQGQRLAQTYARDASGPHGRLYYKRITSEMTGVLSGEYGPTGNVDGNAVGAGWRHGSTNNDLPNSADVQGPKFAADILDAADDLFWPGV